VARLVYHPCGNTRAGAEPDTRAEPEALFLLIWVLNGKKSYWFRQIDTAAALIEKGRTNDVYVGVGLSASDNGDNRRCRSDEVAGIAGMWADFDLLSAAHANKALPGSIEAALTIIPPDLPPTIIVTTGNGVHAWWLFEKPWIFGRQHTLARCCHSPVIGRDQRHHRWISNGLEKVDRLVKIPACCPSRLQGSISFPQPRPVVTQRIATKCFPLTAR
jgi:hypothetical protein